MKTTIGQVTTADDSEDSPAEAPRRARGMTLATVLLAAGDVLVLFAITWIGFSTHGENLAGARWLATFLPLCAAWGCAASWGGLFRPENRVRPVQAWRVLPAVLLAGPLAVTLRGLLLNAAVLPVFAVVISAFTALGLLVWRLAYAVIWAAVGGGRHG
jgi:hypothetical protein